MVVALSSFLVATHELGAWPWIDRRPLRERYIFRYVSRIDLNPVLNAPGRLESSQEDRDPVRARKYGRRERGSVVDDSHRAARGNHGQARRRSGDARGSTYEEMLRQQTITVEQAKASHLQAQLNHEIALLAVREYRDGTVQETLKGMEGSIALARSDLSRAQDHLTWTKRMSEKGYASPAQIVSEKHSVVTAGAGAAAAAHVARALPAIHASQDRENPSGTGQIRGNQPRETKTSAFNASSNGLELLKKQVERCTIRAPHDGLLLYHKDRRQGGRYRGRAWRPAKTGSFRFARLVGDGGAGCSQRVGGATGSLQASA